MIDLRVDDSRTPLVERHRLLDIYWSGELIAQGNQTLNAGDVAAGLELLLAARDRSPGNDNAWMALASAYLKDGQKAKSLEALARAIERNPSARRLAQRNTNLAALRDDRQFVALTKE